MSTPALAFVSVFLSLVLGQHPVEVAVSDAVHSVEILLDDRLVGTLDAPPWRLDCDFGPSLEPHRLEAVAYDGEDEEIARVTQWINLPQPAADASVIIEREPDGGTFARLNWVNVVQSPPTAIRFSFDGQPLEFTDPRRIPLPDHDLEQLHFLRAEIEFPHGVSTLVEATFGGSFSDQISAELTALPIHVEDGRKPPKVDEIRSWFRSARGEARVAALDKGPAEIVIIRDQDVQERLEMLSWQRRSAAPTGGAAAYASRFSDRLKTDQSIGLLWPFMQLNETGVWTFPPTYGWLSSRDGGVAWFLKNFRPVVTEIEKQQLADAVAVAGMNALSRNRRRAVVLILGERPADSSSLSPAMARDYLADLRVPLHVWSPFEHPDSPWGEVEDISNPSRFRSVVKQLSGSVDRQRIVWFEGRHLPQEIELAADVPGVSLVFMQ